MATKVVNSTAEYRTIEEHYPELVSLVKHETGGFSDACRKSGLISDDTLGYARTFGIPDEDKARKMLDAVRDNVKHDTTVFDRLIEVLNSDGYSKSTAGKMCATLAELRQPGNSGEPLKSGESDNKENGKGPQFLYLNMEGMTEHERFTLQGKLKEEAQKMERCFDNFTVSVEEMLKSYDLEAVKGRILKTTSIEVKHKEVISQKKSITEVFNVLLTYNYISFFNYHLLEDLVTKFGSDEDHKKLDAYKEELKEYSERNVFEVPKSVFDCDAPKDARVLALKSPKHVLTLNDAQEILHKLVHDVFDNVQLTDFRLCEIKKGCVELHFLVSAAVAERVFPVTPSQHSALSEIGVRVIELLNQETHITKKRCIFGYRPIKHLFTSASKEMQEERSESRLEREFRRYIDLIKRELQPERELRRERELRCQIDLIERELQPERELRRERELRCQIDLIERELQRKTGELQRQLDLIERELQCKTGELQPERELRLERELRRQIDLIERELQRERKLQRKRELRLERDMWVSILNKMLKPTIRTRVKLEPRKEQQHFTTAATCTGQSATLEFEACSSEYCHKFSSTLPKVQAQLKHSTNELSTVNIEDTPTTIGGNRYGVYSNKLYSLRENKWQEDLPPMPTKRQKPGAVYTKNKLIVAGGDNGRFLSTVEMLDIAKRKWSSVSSLPFTTNQPSMRTIGDTLYLHPGHTQKKSDQFSVLKCSITNLEQSNPSSRVWQRIAPLPVRRSSLIAVDGRLLAVGGLDTKPTRNVYQYNEVTDSWAVVGQMLIARYACQTALLPDNKLMVFGGIGVQGSIELAEIARI